MTDRTENLHILLVEDEDSQAELIKKILEIELVNCTVHHTATIQDAKQVLLTLKPDIIISDWFLPDGEGIEIVPDKLSTSGSPIILMSGHGSEEIAVDVMKAGALDYIIKSEDVFFSLPNNIDRWLREWDNIVQRKEAEQKLIESEEKFRSLISNLPNYVLVHADGEIMYVNNAIIEGLGYSREEWIGSSLFSYIGSEIHEKIHDNIERRKKGSIIKDYEVPIISKNGTIVIVDVKGSLIRFNNKPAALAVLTDITARKKMEEDLRKYTFEVETKNKELDNLHKAITKINLELDKKVQERTREIQTLLEQKNDLIIQLGHDLKTPLTPLLAIIPYIIKYESSEKLKELLEIVLNDVRNMRDLVFHILGIAKLQSTDFVLERYEIELKDFTDSIIVNNLQSTEIKELQVENLIPSELMIESDRLHLKSLIQNLIGNAIKYTPQKGTITINAQDKGNEVIISVKDNGIGIKRSDIEKIFTDFYKVDPSRHERESFGLGLSISKRIIDKFQGRIWVDSEGPGLGSTFYVAIPRYSKKKN